MTLSNTEKPIVYKIFPNFSQLYETMIEICDKKVEN